MNKVVCWYNIQNKVVVIQNRKKQKFQIQVHLKRCQILNVPEKKDGKSRLKVKFELFLLLNLYTWCYCSG